MTVSILHPVTRGHGLSDVSGVSALPEQPGAPERPVVPADDGAVVLLNPYAVPDGAEVLGVLVRLPNGGPAPSPAAPTQPAPVFPPVGQPQQAYPSAGRPSTDGTQIHRGLVLDERSRLVHSHGRPLPLTRLEFDLLHFFATHPGRVLTRDNLLTSVWDRDPAWASSRTVDVHVLRLRRALGPEHADALQTVRGVGYRWVP